MKKEKKCNCGGKCKCQEGAECTCGSECKCHEGEECARGDKCKCHEGEKCACGDKDETRVAELTNDLQRVRADFENYRKLVEAQKQTDRKLMRFVTVGKILPLLDDIDRAVGSYEELKPLTKTLEKTMHELGLEKIAIDAEMEFNPKLAEAVMAEGDGENEVVSEVLRPGYYYEGEVLRPAMVKVKKI